MDFTVTQVHRKLNKFRNIEISIFSDHNGIKLVISYRKKTGKLINMWRHAILNNQWVTEYIKKDIKKNLKKNGNTANQRLWNAAEEVLRGKFIAMNAYIKKQARSQITLHLKELESKQSPKLVEGGK